MTSSKLWQIILDCRRLILFQTVLRQSWLHQQRFWVVLWMELFELLIFELEGIRGPWVMDKGACCKMRLYNVLIFTAFGLLFFREFVDNLGQSVTSIYLSNDNKCILAGCLDSTLRLIERFSMHKISSILRVSIFLSGFPLYHFFCFLF